MIKQKENKDVKNNLETTKVIVTNKKARDDKEYSDMLIDFLNEEFGGM